MVNVGLAMKPPSRRTRSRRAATAAAVVSAATAGVPALVMLALGLWGLDRGGMWRDEAVTFQVARRTVPQIWRLLHGVDAVHGLYYLLVHAVLPVHPGEVVLRLPSVCGAAATAGLVAALGARLLRPRVGLWAGLLYAVHPMAGHYAQEGRSYALVAAGATCATLLFVRAVQGAGRWRAYGAVLGVTCWLHEFAVLVLLAHAVSLALARAGARVWRGWASAAVPVVLALVPMAVVSRRQAAQLAWLRRPAADAAQGLLWTFLGPTAGVFWVCLGLAVVGSASLAGERGRLTCAGVALPLTVVPPVALMLVSQVSPLYVDRYVLYALSGAPLLVGAGAERVVAGALGRPSGGRPDRDRLARSPWITLVGVLAVALVLAHQFPLLRADRSPAHRPDDLAAVARAASHRMRSGDAVLYLPSRLRNTALAYPGAFRGVRDVALAQAADGSGTLYGKEAGPAELRRRLAGVARLWVVGDRSLLAGRRTPRSPVERAELAVLRDDFAAGDGSVVGRTVVRLYVRSASARPARASAAAAASRAAVSRSSRSCRSTISARSKPVALMMRRGTSRARSRRAAPSSVSRTCTDRSSCVLRSRRTRPADSSRLTSGDSVPESSRSCSPSFLTGRSPCSHSTSITRYCG
jgi:mannosyltransferase